MSKEAFVALDADHRKHIFKEAVVEVARMVSTCRSQPTLTSVTVSTAMSSSSLTTSATAATIGNTATVLLLVSTLLTATQTNCMLLVYLHITRTTACSWTRT
jgi:hypothetical protein